VSGSGTGRILVVDDNLQNRKLVEACLAQAGYSVVLAESGMEALCLFEERTPDMVLLDVGMPGMDGFETCTRMRAMRGGNEVPIVFVTGLTDLGSHHRAMASGADDFLSKPVNRTELLLRVRSLLWIRKLRGELNAGYDLIRSQRDALLTAQQQREGLTSLVIHDLKSPLSTILFNAEALVDTCTGEDGEAARQIVAASMAMSRMVMNLLDISRSEDGALVPRIAKVALHELANELREGQALRDDRQTLEIESAQLTIDGDAELLRRMIENLLDNAKKYSPAGTTIRLGIEPVDTAWVEIRVTDQGAGIPPEMRDRIFEKYARLERESAEYAESSRGLGLTFCRLAAEVHGGRIWVDDNPQGGCAFHVRIPISHQLRAS